MFVGAADVDSNWKGIYCDRAELLIGVNVGDLKTTRVVHFVDILQLVHDRVGRSAVWKRNGSIIDPLGYRVEHRDIVHEVKINAQCDFL